MIEAYLDQQLSQSERAEFEQRALDEQEWTLKIKEVESLRKGVEKHLLKEELERIHQEAYSGVEKSKSIQAYWPWLAAAAVAVFILAGISIFGVLQDPNERLFEAYYEVDPGLITAMSGSEQYEFDRGMVDFKSGNYQEALAFWEPLLAQSDQDTLVYFIAIAEIEEGKFEEAEDKLRQVSKRNDSEFQEDATWTLVLLYVRKGQIEEAIELLKTSSHPRSAELLKELE